MSATEEWLSIPQAAKRLGIQERQVRRYAARLSDSDRTQDRTETGRPRLLVRQSALFEMAGRVQDDRASAESDRTKAGHDDRPRQDTSVETGILPSAAYQRVIVEQASRIEDLNKRVDSLEMDKGRLHDALRLSQENLAREQTLRSLPAPEQSEAPANAPATVKRQFTHGALANAAGSILGTVFLTTCTNISLQIHDVGVAAKRYALITERVAPQFPLLVWGSIVAEVLQALLLVPMAVIIIGHWAGRTRYSMATAMLLGSGAGLIVACQNGYALWLFHGQHYHVPNLYNTLYKNFWEASLTVIGGVVLAVAFAWSDRRAKPQ